MKIYKKIKNISKNDIMIWVILSIVFGVFCYWNLRYAVINYDDYRFLRVYREMIQSDCWFKTMIYATFNYDLGNEFRTYALLKTVTVLFAGTIGFNAKVYALIMTLSHIVSSIILYKVLRTVLENNRICVICAGVWLFNPFTTLQTLHHWLYIMVPAYAFIGLCYVHFCLNMQKRNKIVLEMFFIICCAFFGEGMMISLAVYFILILYIDFKRKDNINLFLHFGQGVILSVLLCSYYSIYKLKIYIPNEAERFPLTQMIAKMKSLPILFYSIIAKDVENIIIIINKFDMSYVRNIVDIKFVLISCILILTVYIIIIILISNKNSVIEESSKNNYRMILIVLVSTYAVWFLLQTFTTGYFPVRYMSVCIPCLLIALFIYIDRHISKIYIRYTIILFFVMIVSLSSVIHYVVMIPHAGNYRASIEQAMEQGHVNGKKYVLFTSTYPNYNLDTNLFQRLRYPTLMTESEQFCKAINSSGVAEPLSMYWILDDYVRENTSLIPAFTWAEEMSDNQVKLITRNDPYRTPSFTEINYDYIICDKKDVMIISTEDLYYYDAFNEREGFKVYYNWSEFYNSGSYYGANIYADGLGSSYEYADAYVHNYSDYIDLCENSIFAVNLGGPKTTYFYADAPYPTKTSTGISYGYVNPGAISSYTDLVKGVHGTNRNANFSYHINLSKSQDVSIALEFEDIWSTEVGDRVFDIRIKTDSRQFTLSNVDLFRLTKLNNLVCLEIPIGKTQGFDIEFIKTSGSKDIPFCNAIRVLAE